MHDSRQMSKSVTNSARISRRVCGPLSVLGPPVKGIRFVCLSDWKGGGSVSARASSTGDARMLFGRDKDLELLRAFVEESSCDGHALLLSRSPGVGKPVRLDAAATHAGNAALRG